MLGMCFYMRKVLPYQEETLYDWLEGPPWNASHKELDEWLDYSHLPCE